MAKNTHLIEVGSAWTLLSSGQSTMLAQRLSTDTVIVAVAAVIGDLDPDDRGHVLSGDLLSISFSDLGGLSVFAKCPPIIAGAESAPAMVMVTRY